MPIYFVLAPTTKTTPNGVEASKATSPSVNDKKTEESNHVTATPPVSVPSPATASPNAPASTPGSTTATANAPATSPINNATPAQNSASPLKGIET